MSPRCGVHRRGEQGLSIIELSVVLLLMSVVGLMFFNLFTGTMKTTMMLESRADLNVLGQRTVNRMRTEMMQARQVMQDDAVGLSYLAQIDLDSSTPVLEDSELPSIETDGVIQPEATGEDYVGNSVFMARQLPALEVSVDHDNDSNTPDVTVLIDNYEFQYYYQTKRFERDFDSNGFYLDFVRANSGVYADYFQLSGFTASIRQQIHTQLATEGITFCWDPGELATAAYYQMMTDGTLSARPAHRPDMRDTVSMVPEMAGGRITGKMVYSVGVNGAVTEAGDVPIGVMTAQSGMFPSGMETIIVGPSGSRKIYLRLSMMTEQTGAIGGHVNEVVISNADF